MKNQHGAVHWVELISNDVESSKKHYQEMFGWDAESMPMPNGEDYTVFKIGEMPAAGLIPMSVTTAPEGTPNHWFTYFAVNDANEACSAASESGGAVMREPFYVPGVGSHAILQSADGSFYGIVQPDDHDC